MHSADASSTESRIPAGEKSFSGLNALAEHPEKLLLAVQGSSDGFWIWDVGAPTFECSPRFAQLMGYTPEEFGTTIERFNQHVHPDDFDRLWTTVEMQIQEAATYDIRYRLRTKSGEYRWFRGTGTAFEATTSTPRRIAGTIQDVTELVIAEEALVALHAALDERVRQRTEHLERANRELQEEINYSQQVERELRASEAKFHDLFDNAPDLYVIADPHSRKILECNQTILSTLGFEKDELIGTDVLSVYHPDCLEEGREACDVFTRTGAAYHPRLTLLCKDGRTLDVSLRVQRVRDAQERILYSRSAWRDISEQVATEQQLQEHEAALAHVARVATMGEIATGMAHELNQPLQTIMAYAKGCLERIQRGNLDQAQLAAAAEAVAAEAHRASEIIRRLRGMVLRRPEAPSDVRINEVVREVRLLLRTETSRQQVRVCEDLSPDLPTLRGDKIQLQQLVLNLVQNAFQALAGSDAAERIVAIRTELQDTRIALSIADNGPGIAAEDVPRIFDTFFTKRAEGMGIGLPICRTIAEAHGGTLTAENSPIGGAVFTLLLPLEGLDSETRRTQ